MRQSPGDANATTSEPERSIRTTMLATPQAIGRSGLPHVVGSSCMMLSKVGRRRDLASSGAPKKVENSRPLVIGHARSMPLPAGRATCIRTDAAHAAIFHRVVIVGLMIWKPMTRFVRSGCSTRICSVKPLPQTAKSTASRNRSAYVLQRMDWALNLLPLYGHQDRHYQSP